MDDLYKTIESPSQETLFKDRNSKFYGYAFPVNSENDIKASLQFLKKNILLLVTFVMLGNWELILSHLE